MEQAEIHSHDRGITKLNDLLYGKFDRIGTLAAILVGTDPAEYAKKCVVIHVKQENGRIEVIAAHAGPRGHDEESWIRRDRIAADKPEKVAIVVEFMYVRGSNLNLYSHVLSYRSFYEVEDTVAEMREDMDKYVKSCIEDLNK